MKTIVLRESAELPPKLRRHFPHGGLRKYQADMAFQLYDALSSGFKSVVVEGPTGLGKGL